MPRSERVAAISAITSGSPGVRCARTATLGARVRWRGPPPKRGEAEPYRSMRPARCVRAPRKKRTKTRTKTRSFNGLYGRVAAAIIDTYFLKYMVVSMTSAAAVLRRWKSAGASTSTASQWPLRPRCCSTAPIFPHKPKNLHPGLQQPVITGRRHAGSIAPAPPRSAIFLSSFMAAPTIPAGPLADSGLLY